MKILVRTALKSREKASNSSCSRALLKLLLVLIKQLTRLENFSKQASEWTTNPKQKAHLNVLAKLKAPRLIAFIHLVY